MDPRTGVRAAVDVEGLTQSGCFSVQEGEVHALGPGEAETGAVDVGWADDGGVELVAVLLGCFLDDLVDVAVEGGGGEIPYRVDVGDVGPDFGVEFAAVGVGLPVGDDAGSA